MTTTKVKALTTANVTVFGRTIMAKEGEEYELAFRELERMPPGYFAPASQFAQAEETPKAAPPPEEHKKKRR